MSPQLRRCDRLLHLYTRNPRMRSRAKPSIVPRDAVRANTSNEDFDGDGPPVFVWWVDAVVEKDAVVDFVTLEEVEDVSTA